MYILILPLLLAWGCSSRHCQKSSSDYTIILASGGGFSGQVTGTTIHPDRSVVSWRELRGGRDEQELGVVSDDDYRALIALIEEDLLDAASSRESGNMTSSLEVNDGDEALYFSWPGDGSDDAAIPPDLRKAVISIRSILARTRKPDSL